MNFFLTERLKNFFPFKKKNDYLKKKHLWQGNNHQTFLIAKPAWKPNESNFKYRKYFKVIDPADISYCFLRKWCTNSHLKTRIIFLQTISFPILIIWMNDSRILIGIKQRSKNSKCSQHCKVNKLRNKANKIYQLKPLKFE